MRAKTNENTSAIKRLIPAIAMLALSAVTLSTSTYAWFTMSKEVSVTGLDMTATSSGGIEIALASVTGSVNNINFSGDTYYKEGHPKDDETELGWKSAVVVGNYYKDIGKLMPASSTDGTKLFYATDASNGGKTASKFADVFQVSDPANGMAALDTWGTVPTEDKDVANNGTPGYYVDIPVHIRSSKAGTEEKAIYYKMAINDNDASNTKELYKAVRVAFLTADKGTSKKVSGADNTYYGNGPVSAIDADGKGTKTVATIATGTDNAIFEDSATDNYKNSTGADSGLKIQLKNDGTYGHLDFVVRIWLEGESKLCHDQNSGQSWSIDMAFMLPDSTSTPATPTP